ncbi:MAG: hypothetical protein QG604_384 [Candidatus Dependentiae bacterium]|nr:hypothetical protein [Candidatus Dependentiae bacterium]
MKHFCVLLMSLFVVTGVSPVVDRVFGSANFQDKTFDELEVNGSATLKDVRADSVTARGSLDFSGLTVNTTLSAKGGCTGDHLTARECSFFGGSTLKHATVSSVEARGSFAATEVLVTNDLLACGSLDAVKVTVRGLTTINGGAKLVDSNLQDIVCAGREYKLYNTTVSNIVVKPAYSDAAFSTGIGFFDWLLSFFKHSKINETKIYLKGSTRVSGDIIFEAGSGEVYLLGDALIGGRVTGGVIKKG